MRATVCAILLAGLAAAAYPAWGAELSTHLDPGDDYARFKVTYGLTVTMFYPPDSSLSEFLYDTREVFQTGAGLDDPAVQQLLADINDRIRSDGSQASVDNLAVAYIGTRHSSLHYTGASFTVTLTGNVRNFVIAQDQNKTLIDLGWRNLSSDDSIVIDGIDINIPLNVLRDHDPVTYDLVQGTSVAERLSAPLINATNLNLPLASWRYTFDPTGGVYITLGNSNGSAVSLWFGGEHGHELHENVAGVTHPSIPGEVSYEAHVKSSSRGSGIAINGEAVSDTLDGVDVAVVTASPIREVCWYDALERYGSCHPYPPTWLSVDSGRYYPAEWRDMIKRDMIEKGVVERDAIVMEDYCWYDAPTGYGSCHHAPPIWLPVDSGWYDRAEWNRMIEWNSLHPLIYVAALSVAVGGVAFVVFKNRVLKNRERIRQESSNTLI